jgi:hypothetical protein
MTLDIYLSRGLRGGRGLVDAGGKPFGLVDAGGKPLGFVGGAGGPFYLDFSIMYI